MVLRAGDDYPEHMTDIFDVIADGTRRDILQLLLRRTSEGEAGTSVSQIVADLGISQPTVSKHLKVLRVAELVTVCEDGQRRFYSLAAEPPEGGADQHHRSQAAGARRGPRNRPRTARARAALNARTRGL